MTNVRLRQESEIETRRGFRLRPPMAGEVDCWLLAEHAGLDPLPPAASFLAEDEYKRWTEMGDRERARQFASSRWRTKQLLSAYLGTSLLGIRFELNSNGKPRLASRELEFNLSHTQGWFALAVSAERPVGIDLERKRPVPQMDRIARKFFTESEVAALERVGAGEGDEAREHLFFRLWSAKEALIKGLGGGVFKNVLETELSLTADGQLKPERLGAAGESSGPPRAEDWVIEELAVSGDVVGMLAVGPPH